MKILLKIAYLGSRYCGYQVQSNGITVQKTLQDAVEALYGVRYPITGCSRTDSGVHASCFYCTVTAGEDAERIPMHALPVALGSRLPDDISVLEARLVPDAFHPRYDAVRKEYCYRIWNRREKNPFLADRAYHYPRALNIDEMNRATQAFLGSHDFSGFMSSGSNVKETVRRIDSFRVESDGEGDVRIYVCANGFLYNMVRILVGTLIAVSEGRTRVEDLPAIIESRDRSLAGSTAPPQGLYLNRVEYDWNDKLPQAKGEVRGNDRETEKTGDCRISSDRAQGRGGAGPERP